MTDFFLRKMRIVMNWSVVGVFLFALMIAVLPTEVSAQAAVPTSVGSNFIPQCALSTGSCAVCEIVSFFAKIADLILSLITGVVILMVVIGGIFWITSAGNAERVDRGKQIILGAFVGAIFVFTGFIIINLTMLVLLGGSNGKYEIVTPFGNTPWNQFCEDVKPAGAPNYIPVNCNTTAEQGKSCDNGTTDGVCAKGAGCVCKRGPAPANHPTYLLTNSGYYCGSVNSSDFCLDAANDGKACTTCTAPGGCKCKGLTCLSALCVDPKNTGKQCADASCGAAGCVCQSDGTCQNSSASACVGVADGASCVSAACPSLSSCVCSGSVCKDECTGKALRELNGAFSSATCVTDPVAGCINQGGQITGSYDCSSPSQQCCLK